MNDTTGRNATEKLAFAILAQIGLRKYSFFDDGITEDSGIWRRNCLRDETGGDKAAATRAIKKLVAMGFLEELAGSDDGDEGPWVCLTKDGADTALSLAAEWAAEDAPADAPKKAKADTRPRSWSSHKDCSHAKTPKDRAACRKARAAGVADN